MDEKEYKDELHIMQCRVENRLVELLDKIYAYSPEQISALADMIGIHKNIVSNFTTKFNINRG